MKGKHYPRCPYCGEKINYFFLYDCKKYEAGRCPRCGGYFQVSYPAAPYYIFAACTVLLGISLFVSYGVQKRDALPIWALCMFVLLFSLCYFLFPLLMLPKKWRLTNPVQPRQEKTTPLPERPAKVRTGSEKKERPPVVYTPRRSAGAAGKEKPTIQYPPRKKAPPKEIDMQSETKVIGRAVSNETLDAEERYRRFQENTRRVREKEKR